MIPLPREILIPSDLCSICTYISAVSRLLQNPEPVFLNVYGGQESIPRNEFLQPKCSLAGQYDNPIPRFLAPIDSLKIPALFIPRTGPIPDCRLQPGLH
jgi:hypothetical protein